MKYNVLRRIEQVGHFYLSSNEFFVSYKDELINMQTNLKYKFEKKSSIMDVFSEEHLFVCFSDGVTYLLENNSFVEFPYQVLTEIKNGKYIVGIGYDSDSFMPIENVYDYNNKHFLFKESVRGMLYDFDDVYICVKRLGINNINIVIYDLNGDLLWQQDLSAYSSYTDSYNEYKKGEIQKIIGVYQGIIWVAVTNCTLLGLDEKTGEIRYKIRELPDTKELMTFEYGILDTQRGIIVNLLIDFYCEIDCTTGIVSYWILADKYNGNDVHAGGSAKVHDGENIYFLDSLNKNGSIVAIFHIPTKKIVWKYVFERELNMILLEIKYAGGRIYVRDNHNTLHIFEKES
jgi:outer membrane protein assembly factor BamB